MTKKWDRTPLDPDPPTGHLRRRLRLLGAAAALIALTPVLALLRMLVTITAPEEDAPVPGWLAAVGRCGRGIVGWVGVVGLLPLRLLRRVRHSPTLVGWLLGWAVAWLPERYRAQYEAEWQAELDVLKQDDSPLLGWAVWVLATAAVTRVALRPRLAGAAGRVRALPRSRVARAVGQLRPVWLGVLAAVAAFCAAAVGWSGVGQHGPSRAQLVWAVLASLAAGGGVTWQTWPRGPAPGEPPSSEEPERPTRR
jgi:hypothetical protein